MSEPPARPAGPFFVLLAILLALALVAIFALRDVWKAWFRLHGG